MLKKIALVLLVILAILLLSATALFFAYRAGWVSQMFLKNIEVQGENGVQETNLMQKFLGFENKQTFLLLFLNNTELRPGGGFIGAYAVLEVDRGLPKVIKVEGTEILDNLAPRENVIAPPEIMAKYLKTSRWNFRDSNWSPDFSVSAEKALELYKSENGIKAEEIDAVIGFTPTLIEELIKISGPIVVNGEEFNAQNFTEKLEYEVEYNYEKRGYSFENRKQMLKDITYALVAKLGQDALLHWPEYFSLVDKMFKGKQISVYSLDEEIEQMISVKDWGGRVKNNLNEDYILWVDANLGALKTDFSIKRFLTYSFSPDTSNQYTAEAKMKYEHTGKFDWRTTRYLSYVRLYTPAGSELLEVAEIKNGKKTIQKNIDQGEELGKKWFGYFISIEPGDTKELSFKFKVDPSVVNKINNNAYDLLVQKQLGSVGTKLNLNLNFSKRVSSALPGEMETDWGNNNYLLKTDLDMDKNFIIKLTD